MFTAAAVLALSCTLGQADALAPWKAAKVAPVSSADHHSIHAYFNTTPESPDGRFVVFYASTTTDSHEGEIRVRERDTGKETVVARGIAIEDAHRAACQQWVAGGRFVAFHNVLKNGAWVVMAVERDTGKEKVLARGRQLGFGQPAHDLLPIYGPHWDPGQHRGLELVNVRTGDIVETPVTAESIRKSHPEWIARQFGDGPLSIFFPILSPDLSRVLYKLATPAGGDFRSKLASKREGLLVFDLKRSQLLFVHERWGHPAWRHDSRALLNTRGRVIDSDTGKVESIPGNLHFPGSHPSYSPDGRLFVTDVITDGEPYNGPKGSWGVVVVEVATGDSVILHRFDNSRGARSWRVSHPHPVFSPDGRRIYYNVSDGPWTRLHVAEVAR